MSDPIVHKAPSRGDGTGVGVIDATDCCGITQREAFGRGEAFTFQWDKVTCMARMGQHQPRPPCPRCGGDMFLIDDAELCGPQRWVLGHDCLHIPAPD